MGSGMDRWSSALFAISLVMWYAECNCYVNQETRSLLCSLWEPPVSLCHTLALLQLVTLTFLELAEKMLCCTP